MRLSADLCRSWIADMSVARLATVREDGRPHLVPITFALPEADVIVTAVDHKPKSTSDLRRLQNIRAHPRVSVLVDHYSDEWSELWWVRADGHSTVAESGHEWSSAIDVLCDKYAQYQDDPPNGPAIIVTVDNWTGWAARPPTRAQS